MRHILRHLPPYICTLIILIAVCYLSLAPEPMPEQDKFFDFPGSDKVAHLVMYASLTAAFCFDYYRRNSRHNNEPFIFTIAIVVSIIIGGIIEVLQHILPLERSGEILDLVADAAGACLGVIFGIRLFAGLRHDKKED